MLTRRGFLIGAGSLLTAAFVSKATAFSRKAGEPLVLPPAKRPEETLYIYEQEKEGWSYDEDDEDWSTPRYRYGKWRVSHGPDEPRAPPPPSWREHLNSRGYRLDTPDDIKRIYLEKGLTPEELDKPLSAASGWEDMWDNFNSPQAQGTPSAQGTPTSALPAPSWSRRKANDIFEGLRGRPWFLLHLGRPEKTT